MSIRLHLLLAAGVLFVGSSALAQEKTEGPEAIRRVAVQLSELLNGLIRLSEEYGDLPPSEACERLALLANSARELKPTIEPLSQRALAALEKPLPPAPELEEEIRRLEEEAAKVKKLLREIETEKGELSPETKARQEKLRARYQELQAAAERTREKRERTLPRRLEGDLRFFRLEHADAGSLAEILTRLLPPGSTVIPEPRVGKLLVITSPEGYARAERVVSELDQPPRRRPDAERRDLGRRESEQTPRYDYERSERIEQRPDLPKPKTGRTVGTLLEIGEEMFAVRPEGDKEPIEFFYPALMQPGQEPAPSEEFLKKLRLFKRGDPIVVEWNEIEGSRVAVGVSPPPEEREREKESTLLK